MRTVRSIHAAARAHSAFSNAPTSATLRKRTPRDLGPYVTRVLAFIVFACIASSLIQY